MADKHRKNKPKVKPPKAEKQEPPRVFAPMSWRELQIARGKIDR